MPTAASITDVKHFETVEAFLDALNHFSPNPAGGDRRFLFRGHADDAWILLPSALRRDGFKGVHEYPCATTHGEQLSAEWAVMGGFMWFADKWGLAIPEDSVDFREFLEVYPRRVFGAMEAFELAWPHRRFQALLALARHSGLPTRLLDWTSSRMNAVYFAAVRAAEIAASGAQSESSNKLSVWVVESSLFKRNIYSGAGVGSRFGSFQMSVEFFNVPNSSNPNARAQGGWFSVVRARQQPEETVDRRPLDEIVAAELVAFQPTDPIFYRLTLPSEKAKEMLTRLAMQDITAASVFPDYRGAAAAVKELRLYKYDPSNGA